jgi:hypothetical protein
MLRSSPPATVRARPTATAAALPALAYGTPLGSGAAASMWATAILRAMKAPVNSDNVDSLIGWFQREGGGGANNPMNTTLQTSASAGSINSDGVQNYSTPGGGVAATVATLQDGYPAVVAQLKSGQGLGSTSGAVAAELSKWSGGGYSSISPVAPNNGLYTGPLSAPGSNAGMTRPGGTPVDKNGDPVDSGTGVTALLQGYQQLRDMNRVAPPGTKNPFSWWWSSFTGNWGALTTPTSSDQS